MTGEKILLSHGDGGKRTRNLIEEVILKYLGGPILNPLEDSGILEGIPGKVAFTTDSYVVSPPFFPGGDIGKLSICGTVNDLAVSGARPRAISFSLILEEGFSLQDLERVLASAREVSELLSLPVACGDTKVVERGKGDGIFVTTSGIGEVIGGWSPRPHEASPGDLVVVTGPIGDHGIAVLVARENLRLKSPVVSDVAPLSPMLNRLVEEAGEVVLFMRDPTRGGLGVTLNEVAPKIPGTVVIREEAIPVREEVRGVSEILGFDPLYLANEGKAVLIVRKGAEEKILSILREFPEGAGSRVIGEVREGEKGVLLLTRVGGARILDYPVGEQLPRIC